MIDLNHLAFGVKNMTEMNLLVMDIFVQETWRVFDN